jgi:hypothetical protein
MRSTDFVRYFRALGMPVESPAGDFWVTSKTWHASCLARGGCAPRSPRYPYAVSMFPIASVPAYC